ncbi:MAG: LamG domain-containing protein [Victivallales bacterium]|nr:LamG domain-containing protein [Victivallales bacterium]
MRKNVILLVAVMSFVASALSLPDEVAWYPLNEGEGTETREALNRLPPAKITGSFWMNRDGLNLIDFGGMKVSRQAQVTLPPIEFDGEFSIAIWLSAYWWNESWGAICFRSDATYGIRNNKSRPGQIHFRVKDKEAQKGANLFSGTVLDKTTWHHVVATFTPGKSMRIYIDGRLDAERTEGVPVTLDHDKECFHLGRIGKENCYSGVLSNLHLYNRALTGDEVKALWKSENRFGLPALEEELFAVQGGVAARLPGVDIMDGGSLVLHTGKADFAFNSLYAYPAEPYMGYNLLGPGTCKGCEAQWKTTVTQGNEGVTVAAKGAFYSLVRSVSTLPDGRIRLTDSVTNLTQEDQAVVFSHYLLPKTPIAEWCLHGEENSLSASESRMPPTNPTGWFCSGEDALAWVVEDDIFRCHLEATVKPRDDAHHLCTFGSRRIGVPAGGKRIFEMTFYPMQGDYFDFLNRLRRDWKVPEVTLPGPFITVRTLLRRSEVYRGLAADPDAMKAYFARRNARTFTINPWFNYWDGMAFRNREEYRDHVKQVMKTIRTAIPDALFLASLETYTYYVTEEDFTTPAPEDFNWHEATPGNNKRILESPFKDSATLTASGSIELYQGKSEDGAVRDALKLMVHPVIGNHFYKLRLEEFQFLFDEVGLDGVYQDMFGFSSATSIIHTGWDGFSISVSPNGRIASKFTHLGPLTAPARANWLRYILSRKKLALCNFGAPTTREMQTIPYMNFCEAAGNGIGRQNLDTVPPEASGVVMNQLTTPMGYGPHRAEEENGPRLLARVRAYLRHGALYVHTSVRNSFPSDGEKGGEYGPINHSYPITPVELHRGWVKGKERIVSCVSYKTRWGRAEKPVALRFDANGRTIPLDGAAVVTGNPGEWDISVTINDWNEFLIIE